MNNKLSIILLAIVVFGICSCGDSRKGSAPANKNQAYSLVMTSYNSRFGNLKTRPGQLALYLPKKHMMVFFLGLEHNDEGQYIANTLVYAAREDANGAIPVRLVAHGKSEHGFGQPHVVDANVPYPMMYDRMTFLACNDSSQVQLAAAYSFMGNYEYVFLIPNDEATSQFDDLLGHEEFAGLKEFIDSYQPAADLFPMMDEKQMADYRVVLFGPDFLLDRKGIQGVLALGDAIEKVPQKVDGLYDKLTITDEEDEVEGAEYRLLSFTQAGEEVMSAFSYDQKTVSYLMVTSPLVKYFFIKKYLGCGDELTSRNFYGTDDYGRLNYQGIFIDENADGTIHSLSIGEPLF